MFLVSLMAVLSRYVPKRCEAPTGAVTKIRELVDFGGEPGKLMSPYFSPYNSIFSFFQEFDHNSSILLLS